MNYTFRATAADPTGEGDDGRKTIPFDAQADDRDLEPKLVMQRALAYLAWLLAFLGATALIGMLPTIVLFVAAYMRVEGRERWALTLTCAVLTAVASWFIFDRLLALPWPNSLLGELFPRLRVIVPSV